ncbi:MAG: hypothetical protein HZB13_01150 [Acidobacteria bacterium]|nr:hypothetical protein [Acidobacteriota bacterium]
MTRPMRLIPGALLAAAVWAGGPTAWESNTFADFVKGRFNGVSLTRDGRLTLAPSLVTLAATGDAGVWSVVSAADGTVYFSSGHRGRVYQLKPGGQPVVVFTAPQPEVFALALDKQGRLYAGSSPGGKIWRIENGKAAEYFDPKARYIWSLAVGADGALLAGTGDNGQVWRITGPGQGEVWYETGQTHVTSLALDGKGRPLAGTEPNGILYRIEGKNRAFVLYDASLPEIRAIVPAADGSVYVAALGGGLAQKQAQAASTAAAAPQGLGMVTTSITVTSDADAAAQTGVDLKPKPEQAKPPAGSPETPPAAGAVDLSGVEKAAIYRIWPDNMVETLWSSKEENVFDLAVRENDLVFSTDQRGRIYRLSADLKSTLLLETREGETTRLLPTPQGLLAATSNLGKLFRLSPGPGASGTYESAVHDASNVARWGHLEWRSDGDAGKLAFRTRSGNSARPDKTWSEWSEPITEAARAAIASPNARYIQWQVEIAPGQSGAPLLDAVSVSYQPQNGRPVVRSIQVTPQWVAAAQKTAAAASPAPVSYSITVTDSGDAAGTSSGTPTQNVNRSGSPQLFISWQADDPDSDKLVYTLSYRAEDERDWKQLKADLAENTLMQEAEIFADGRYFFRVTASDRLANGPSTAREAELVSQPVLIDQTPPRLTLGTPRRNGNEVEIDVDAADSGSPIRRGEFSVNGQSWRGLEVADGIADGRAERFVARFTAGPGEQSVVVRVFDSAGNPGLARVVLR